MKTKRNYEYRMLTNVGHVDCNGIRLWCHFVTIDVNVIDEELKVRQIRGGTFGGLPVFTIWIDPEEEVMLIDVAGGNQILLSHDGKEYNLDSGIVIKTRKFKIGVHADDVRRPIVVQDIVRENYPFGDEMDDIICKYTGGTAYPRVVWTRNQWKKKHDKIG